MRPNIKDIEATLTSDPRYSFGTLWVSDDGSEISFMYNTADESDPGLEIDYLEQPHLRTLGLMFDLNDEGDYEGDGEGETWLTITGTKK